MFYKDLSFDKEGSLIRVETANLQCVSNPNLLTIRIPLNTNFSIV